MYKICVVFRFIFDQRVNIPLIYRETKKMKFRISNWFFVILCCLGLGFWQKDNVGTVLREYSSLYRHLKYEDGSMKIHGPFTPLIVAKEDPEAAAVAEIRLYRLNRERDKFIWAIADKLLHYPDNEFLLFELISSIHYWDDKSIIDPQIKLGLAERLIALQPDNAIYHYLKCYLLLMDRHGSDINAALEELEYANKCNEYSFPYDSYRERAISIAAKAKLSRFLQRELWYYSRGSPVTSDIWQKLIGQANAAFTNGDTAEGMRITNALAQMQKRQLRDGDPYAVAIRGLRFFSGACSFGHWDEPHCLELQRADLDKEQAKENRLQLCTLMATPKKNPEEKQDQHKKEKEKQTAFLAVPPAVHAGQMFVAFLWSCAILLVISVVSGFGERNKVTLSGILLFITSCVFYFCIVKGFFLAPLLDSFSCYHFSYIDVLRLFPRLNLIEDEPVLAGLFLAGPVLAALLLWALGFVRPKKGAFWKRWYIRVLVSLSIGIAAVFVSAFHIVNYKGETLWPQCLILGGLIAILAWGIITFAWWLFRCRIVRLLLVAAFLGSVTILAGGYRYVQYLPMIVFILAGAIMAVVKPGEMSSLKTVLRLFSRRPDVAAIRSKCLRLTAPFIVVYWVLFISLTPLVAKSIDLEFGEFKTVVRRVILPEADEAYEELMSTFEAEGLKKTNVHRLLGLVMPEDLPALLHKLKNKEFADDYYPWPLAWPGKKASEEENARLEKMKEQRRRLNDADLVLAMRSCGKDVVGIITAFLDNPDAEQALVARARLGDSTTKEKLEELLQTRMQNELDKKEDEQPMRYGTYLDRPAKEAEIIGALACISEPNEAMERFLDYIQNQEVSDLLIENHKFFEGVTLLPTTHARKVLKAYLVKAHSWQPPEEKTHYGLIRHRPDRVLYPLRRIVGLHGDRQIAEEIFKIMLSAVDKEQHFESFDISPYFQGRSAGLLKQGLTCSNSDTRAWCVWQLRKIGYEWSIEEIGKLLTDKSWKVRANVAAAAGKEITALAANDRNSFVRAAASLWAGN